MKPTIRWWFGAVLLVGTLAERASCDEAQDKRLTADIEKTGGLVRRDETKPGKPVVEVGWFLSDAIIRQLKGLKELQVLRLWSPTYFTDPGLANLKDFDQLQKLYLSGLPPGSGESKVADADLANLKELKQLHRSKN